jgi:hypothetical protein
MSLLLACVIGQVIGWIYMWTHVSPSYSRSFSASMVTLPVIVALMMMLMAGSTAIAFGLLAVFAVVRFRNVLKDTRDTTFVLWAIVEGMGVGTMHYAESICGLIVIGCLIAYLRITDFGGRHQFDAFLSLDLEGSSASFDQNLMTILKRHAMKWSQSGETQFVGENTSISYQVLLRDPTRSEELRQELLDQDAVKQMSLFVHDRETET